MRPLRRTIGVGALALIWCGLAAPALADTQLDCGMTQAASLPMKTDIAGRRLVSARIDGRNKYVLVDTGAVYTMLTDETAQEMNLRGTRVPPHQFIFVNGASAAQTARVHSFELGPLSLGALTVLVTPPSLAIPGASGALGPDVMRQFDVEFDFGRGRLNLFSQDHCDGGVVYWTNAHHTSLSFELDGSGHITTVALLDRRLVDVIIDTGAVATTMLLDDARHEFGITPGAGLRRVDGEGEPLYSHTFRTLDLEGITVQRPTIVIRPDHGGNFVPGMRPEIILGMTELSKLHLYIAYRERKIYITAAGDR